MVLKKFKQHCLLGAVATLPLLLDSAETMQRRNDSETRPASSSKLETKRPANDGKDQSNKLATDEKMKCLGLLVDAYRKCPDGQGVSGRIIFAQLEHLKYTIREKCPVSDDKFKKLASQVNSDTDTLHSEFDLYMHSMIQVLKETEHSTKILLDKYPWLWRLFETTTLSVQEIFGCDGDYVKRFQRERVFELLPHLSGSSNEPVQNSLKTNVQKLVTFLSGHDLTEEALVRLHSDWRKLADFDCDLDCKLFITSEIRSLEKDTGYEWYKIYSTLIGLIKVFSQGQKVTQQHVLTRFEDLTKFVPAIQHKLAADAAMSDIVFSFDDVIRLLSVIEVPDGPVKVGIVYDELCNHLRSLRRYLENPETIADLNNGLIDPSPSNLVNLFVQFSRVTRKNDITSTFQASHISLLDTFLGYVIPEQIKITSDRVKDCAKKLSVDVKTMRTIVTDYKNEHQDATTNDVLTAVKKLTDAKCNISNNKIGLCISLLKYLERQGLLNSILRNLDQLELDVTDTQYWTTYCMVARTDDELKNHTATIQALLSKKTAVKK